MNINGDRLSVGAAFVRSAHFTAEHKDMIERAVNKCTHLIVFVIGENVPMHKYEEEFEFIKTELKDLKNVIAIPYRDPVHTETCSEDNAEFAGKNELPVKIRNFFEETVPSFQITKLFVDPEFYNKLEEYHGTKSVEIIGIDVSNAV